MPEGTQQPVIRVLVADEIANIVQDLGELAERAPDLVVCGVARREIDIATEAATQHPDVLLLRRNFAGSDPAHVVAGIAAVSPQTRIVLLESDMERRARVAGIAVVAPGNVGIDELVSVIRQAAAQPAPGVASNGHAAAAEALEPIAEVPQRRPRRSSRRGEVILVFSGKGGVGKSLLAANLAVALSRETDGRVALVDLNLQFGDAGVMLHVEHHPTAIEDLTQQGEELEADFLEQVMADGPAETRVLLAPSSPEYADLVSTASLRAIFRELGRAYDYVVVDSAAYLEDRIVETIETSDLIILVTTANITSVKNTKITLGLFAALGVPPDRIAIVLNQHRAKPSFSRAEIEEILRMRVLTQLPYDQRVDETIDAGKALVEVEPKSEFTKQVRAVVEYIVSSGQPDEEPEEDTAAPAQQRSAARANRRRFSLGRK